MRDGDLMGAISISNGNQKMGGIPSVSLPSIITCRTCDCHTKCYARKIERIRKNVRDAYQRNLHVLNNDPDTYWREVEASIMMSRYFRFHVSGDIPDERYFRHMVLIALRNPHCQILCFTKKYEIVNRYKERGLFIPDNLHIVFSAWVGLDMPNPFLFPVAYVRHRDGTCIAPPEVKECGGNCMDCAITDGGCWTLKFGESVVFNEH